MKLKKTDLTNQIIKNYQFGVQSLQNKPMNKTDINKVISLTFGAIAINLVKGNTVPVPIGQFEVHHRKARKGRNPQTGEQLTIAPRRAVVFKPSSRLKDTVNHTENND